MSLLRQKLSVEIVHKRLRSSRQKLAPFWSRITHKIPRKRLAVAVGLGVGLIAWGFVVAFLWPRTVQFAYATPSCFTNPVILPGLVHQTHQSTFRATPSKTIDIAGHTLYSHSTCITPVAGPKANATERITLQPFGVAFIYKTIRVSAGTLPSVNFKQQLTKPIPTHKPLVFDLHAADRVFDYQLAVGTSTAPCAKNGTQLSCNMSKLQLAQSANYTLTMQRLFAGRVQNTVFEQTVTTVGAVQLVASSIAAGQTVYDTPTHLTLTFNKLIDVYDGAQLFMITADGTRQRVGATISPKDTMLDFVFDEALPRSATFEAHVDIVVALDSGHLPEPLTLSFSTSGGPKVQSTSIGAYKVPTGDNITLTFDTAVSGSQNLSEFIQVQVGGSAVAASLSRSGSRVIINPTANLPGCTRFTIKVLDGLQNESGVAGGSAWTYNSRTTCQSTFSIGTSVNGRGITAYRFGSGGSTVVYAGNLHGNEKSANATLVSWIDYLERNIDNIPAGRTIVVIPNLNPDGYAANTRTNAHDVDLNRNFPVSNWKQSVTMPGGAVNPNGGGSSPLSEPESSAFASYITSVQPRLVITYHGAAGVVMPNDAGDSNALAQIYDQKSNLNYEPTSQTSDIFEYDTTGSFEDWANEKRNTPVLLVELWTKTNNEFTKNQNAMWHMATL